MYEELTGCRGKPTGFYKKKGEHNHPPQHMERKDENNNSFGADVNDSCETTEITFFNQPNQSLMNSKNTQTSFNDEITPPSSPPMQKDKDEMKIDEDFDEISFSDEDCSDLPLKSICKDITKSECEYLIKYFENQENETFTQNENEDEDVQMTETTETTTIIQHPVPVGIMYWEPVELFVNQKGIRKLYCYSYVSLSPQHYFEVRFDIKDSNGIFLVSPSPIYKVGMVKPLSGKKIMPMTHKVGKVTYFTKYYELIVELPVSPIPAMADITVILNQKSPKENVFQIESKVCPYAIIWYPKPRFSNFGKMVNQNGNGNGNGFFNQQNNNQQNFSKNGQNGTKNNSNSSFYQQSGSNYQVGNQFCYLNFQNNNSFMVDSYGYSEIDHLVCNGDCKKLEIYLKNVNNLSVVNKKDHFGNTPIFYSFSCEKVEQLLIKNGSMLKTKNFWGQSYKQFHTEIKQNLLEIHIRIIRKKIIRNLKSLDVIKTKKRFIHAETIFNIGIIFIRKLMTLVGGGKIKFKEIRKKILDQVELCEVLVEKVGTLKLKHNFVFFKLIQSLIVEIVIKNLKFEECYDPEVHLCRIYNELSVLLFHITEMKSCTGMLFLVELLAQIDFNCNYRTKVSSKKLVNYYFVLFDALKQFTGSKKSDFCFKMVQSIRKIIITPKDFNQFYLKLADLLWDRFSERLNYLPHSIYYNAKKVNYDVVFKIENSNSLQSDGWIYIEKKNKVKLLRGLIASLLGNFQSGKSWLLKKISLEPIMSTNSIDTPGICFKSVNEKFEDKRRPFIIVDSQGKNSIVAPLKNVNLTKDKIEEFNFYENILTDISDVLFYVVDSFNIYEQRTVAKISKLIEDSGKKKELYVIHNCRNIQQYEKALKYWRGIIDEYSLCGIKPETIKFKKNRGINVTYFSCSYFFNQKHLLVVNDPETNDMDDIDVMVDLPKNYKYYKKKLRKYEKNPGIPRDDLKKYEKKKFKNYLNKYRKSRHNFEVFKKIRFWIFDKEINYQVRNVREIIKRSTLKYFKEAIFDKIIEKDDEQKFKYDVHFDEIKSDFNDVNAYRCKVLRGNEKLNLNKKRYNVMIRTEDKKELNHILHKNSDGIKENYCKSVQYGCSKSEKLFGEEFEKIESNLEVLV